MFNNKWLKWPKTHGPTLGERLSLDYFIPAVIYSLLIAIPIYGFLAILSLILGGPSKEFIKTTFDYCFAYFALAFLFGGLIFYNPWTMNQDIQANHEDQPNG
jgi:hypothetical protein